MELINYLKKERGVFMEKKITKREVINAMLAEDVVKANEVYVNYLTNELALLDKKKNSKKETANQKANAELKVTIVDTLKAIDKPVSVSDLLKSSDTLGEFSNQKVSALLRQLVESGEVVKTLDKKKALFSVA